MTSNVISRSELLEARTRIAPYIHRTPVMTSRSLDAATEKSVFLKCENFQRAGSFKTRGAMNFLSQLSPEELARGVVTHSSGNHAQAVALAARMFGTKAEIVMPSTAPIVKRIATEGYGGHVHLVPPNVKAREAKCKQLVDETGGVLIHPYDHETVIYGQATAALELLEEVPDLDVILAPVSGGGLLSGTALAAAAHASPVRVFGCEPKTADDAQRSLRAGHVIDDPAGETIADGLRANLTELTFSYIKEFVSDIICLTEEEIIDAMSFLWERVKIVVEPSGAITLAPLLFHRDLVPGQRVGLILSGGNITSPFRRT